MTLLTLILFVSIAPVQTVPSKNAATSSPESIAAGAKLYGRYCATCHGTVGKGDGAGGAKLNPKPSDLTDVEWKHGGTDVDIFQTIHDGVKNTAMKGFASRMTELELWDLVNYVRSLSK